MGKFIKDYFNDYKTENVKNINMGLTLGIVTFIVIGVYYRFFRDYDAFVNMLKESLVLIPVLTSAFAMVNHKLLLPKMYKLVPMEVSKKKEYLWKKYIAKVIINSIIGLVFATIMYNFFDYSIVSIFWLEIYYIIIALYVQPKQDAKLNYWKSYYGWFFQMVITVVLLSNYTDKPELTWYSLVILCIIQIPLAVKHVLYIKQRINREVECE